MTSDNAAAIAAGLTTEEWKALEYVQVHGNYLINDEDKPLTNFDRVFLKGLLNKIYNQDSSRYFLNVYGKAVLEARTVFAAHTHAGEGKVTTTIPYYYVYFAPSEGKDGQWGVMKKDGTWFHEPQFTYDEADYISDLYNSNHREANNPDLAAIHERYLAQIAPQPAAPQPAPVEGSGVDYDIRYQGKIALLEKHFPSGVSIHDLADVSIGLEDAHEIITTLQAALKAAEERDRGLLEVAKFFVHGYWATVHIGEKLNQLNIHIPDKQLDEFRGIVAKALAAKEEEGNS